MVTLDELEIQTEQGTDSWTATSTDYPAFTGTGETEEDAKLNLVDQINGANTEGESAEAGSEG